MKRILMYTVGFAAIGVFVLLKRDAIMGIGTVVLLVSIFAVILSPFCTWLEKKGMRSSVAALYPVAAFSFIMLLIIAAFIPYLTVQSVHLAKRLSPMATELVQRAGAWTEETGILKIYKSSAASLTGETLSRLTGMVTRFSMNAAAQTGRIAFSLVLTYYVLCDRRRLANHLLLFVPLPWRRAVLVGLCGCKNAVYSYFSGLLKTSAFVSSATTLGLLVLGVEDAVLLGVFMGIFEMLPYIGPIAAAIPILLSSLSGGIGNAIGALILVILVQLLEGNFVSPYFTAASTSIHPLAAIAGVFALGSLFGIWGILTAVPLMVSVQSVLWSLQQVRNMMYEE